MAAAACSRKFLGIQTRCLPPSRRFGLSSVYNSERKNLQSRLAVYNAKNPAISNPVNIGFKKPEKSVSEAMSAIQRNERLGQIHADNPKKILAAKQNKFEVDLDSVDKSFSDCTQNWSEHIYQLCETYSIFKHTFVTGYFYPIMDMDVSYDYDDETVTPVCTGNVIHPKDAQSDPVVSFTEPEDFKDSYWTLSLTNLDGHLQDNEKEYLHWLIGNIPGNKVTEGEVLCDYIPPFPAKGTGHHRMVFLLYRQDGKIDFATEKRPENCTNLRQRTFSSLEFYQKLESNLTPAALKFYQTAYDESVRKTFHNKLEMKEPIFDFYFPEPWHPRQRKFPHKKSFNRYLDRYRDRKEISGMVLKEKMTLINPFEDYPEMPKYPGVRMWKTKCSWERNMIRHKRARTYIYKDLPYYDK